MTVMTDPAFICGRAVPRRSRMELVLLGWHSDLGLLVGASYAISMIG